MLSQIKKWCNDMLTEPNGTTICPVRLMALGGFVYGMGNHAYSTLWCHVAFDLQNFSIAFGALLTTTGIALGMKTDSPKE